MKSIVLTVAFLCAASLCSAEETAQAKKAEQSQIQMHEQMAKAHQQAVDCLKSGKSEEECRKAFHQTCEEAGGPGNCGPWMMHHRAGRKGK